MFLNDVILDDSDSKPKIECIVPERLEFLQGAIKEAMKNTVDPNALINKSKEKLASSSDEDILSSLVEIDSYIELPDCSLSLKNLDLVQSLLECLSRSEDIRCLVYQIFSKGLQNNLPVQEAIGRSNALPILLTKVKQENSEMTISRGIAAISSLIRHNRESEKSFISCELDQIEIWLNSDSLRVREKALSLLRHFLSENVTSEDELRCINNSSLSNIILRLFNENSKIATEKMNIQYSEILSDTLVQLIQVNCLEMMNCSRAKLIELIDARVHFLSEYSKYFPEDDTSPEIKIIAECLNSLRNL